MFLSPQCHLWWRALPHQMRRRWIGMPGWASQTALFDTDQAPSPVSTPQLNSLGGNFASPLPCFIVFHLAPPPTALPAGLGTSAPALPVLQFCRHAAEALLVNLGPNTTNDGCLTPLLYFHLQGPTWIQSILSLLWICPLPVSYAIANSLWLAAPSQGRLGDLSLSQLALCLRRPGGSSGIPKLTLWP